MKVEEGGLDGVGESGGERCSRDLLQRFRLCDGIVSGESPNDESEELELSLGLSLGGRFGIEKGSKRLARSTSVAGAIPFMWEEKLGSVAAKPSASFLSIIRTSSLPTESEEELRKRKEWQSLRRMEVKRRRCEKQRKRDGGDEIVGQGSSTSNETEPNVQAMRAMDEMPNVFTKGDGPNGVRVDGILYKYGKGVEVRIMCVCHGEFLSPAEFVKHAGGGDVANPRRHIFIDTGTVFSQ